MNDVMTETIPAAETGAQDTSDAMTEMIPSVGDTVSPDAALAESAEIIWCPAIAATADSEPTGEIAQTAVIAQVPATMVEATDTAQFIATTRTPATAQAVRRARGRHAAPRSAGTRPSAAGLAKRGEGRHAATRPAGGAGRRFATAAMSPAAMSPAAMSPAAMSPAAMVAAGPSAVTG